MLDAQAQHLDCQNHGLPEIYAMAEDRFINPILHGAEPLSYEQLQEKYQLASSAATAGKIRTVKKRLDLAVRGTIAAYTQDPDELESELRQFVTALPQQVRLEEPKVTTAEFLHSNWRYDLAQYHATDQEIHWQPGEDELPTYVDLFLAERPPLVNLIAVRDMAKQWIKAKVTEVPKYSQSAVYYIPAVLSQHIYQKTITRLTPAEVSGQLRGLCEQADDPLPPELARRVKDVLKALG